MRSSRAERVRRLLEDSKDDSSCESSENKPKHFPFDLPSADMNDESKDDSTAGTGEEELRIEIGSFAGVDGIDDSMNFEAFDRHPLPSLSLKSDREVEELQTKNQHKVSSVIVRSIDAYSNPGAIDEWIFDVEEAHATAKRASSTQSALPDVQALMQAWPQEMTDALASGEICLPTADIDLSLEEYAKVLCTLFSIPVEEGKLVDAIHTMICLFMACKEREASCDISNDISVTVDDWN